MVFITTPESASGITFVESRVRLKHSFGAVGFQHGLGSLDGVLLRDIDWEVHVTSSKAEVSEFEPEVFQIPERLGAGVYMRLFFKTVVVAFGLEHHGDPVVSCVIR